MGLSYFKERGYRDETIRRFGLGFTQESKDDFTQYALSKGHKLEMLKNLGLTSDKGYDFFRNRVMFTIYNLSGKPVAFAGRIMQKDAKAFKYQFAGNGDLHKSKPLRTLSGQNCHQKNSDECIIEGYTDVMTLSQADRKCGCSSGTSLTRISLDFVKRFTPNLKNPFDGDAAGIKAALRGMDLALEQDLNVKIVLLPEKKKIRTLISRR
ncbi:MAG: toprim domain-containing protein [Saprospiraceae bacterium]